MAGGKLGSNPVEAHRRAQKQAELKKLKEERAKRRRDAEDAAEQLKVFRTEYQALVDAEAARTLTPLERARKRELRAAIEKADGGPSSREVYEKQQRGNDAMPSGLFDPLAEQHRLAGRVKRQAAPIPAPDLSEPESESDLDDMWFPPLPREPLPPGHKPPTAPPRWVTMSGYPPPPAGPLPMHPPQMDPPHLQHQATASGAKPKPPLPETTAAPVVAAAPVIRDLHREAIALVPAAVVAAGAAKKRKVVKVGVAAAESAAAPQPVAPHPQPAPPADATDSTPSATDKRDASDEAYQAFLREMEGLL